MAWLGLEFRTPDSKSIHFPLHHLIVYGVEKWEEREGGGFPLINCHSFPGYFVRKTCPGEKEFLLLLLRDWEGDTLPSLAVGYCGPFPWLPPAAEGPEQGTGLGGALTRPGNPSILLISHTLAAKGLH